MQSVQEHPGLSIALNDFQDFLSVLEDKPININDRNFPRLSQLSEEFSFQALSKKLSSHRRSPGLSSAQTAECLSYISVLEERSGQHDQLAALQSALFLALQRFETDLALLSSEFPHFATQRRATLPSQQQSHRLRTHPRSLSPTAAPDWSR
jgi:hypothetical protein